MEIDQALAPPAWARNTVAEPDGVVHEVVSDVHPRTDPLAPGQLWSEVDVSLAVQDRPSLAGWIRSEPTVNVEGGRFSFPEARKLVQAVTDLLALAEETAASSREG